MTFFHAIILGIVEGVTEFLPISSTGHLVLASHILGIPVSDFSKTFEIVIQGGAILAVIALYAEKVIRAPKTIMLVLAAFIPTAIIGFSLYPLVKGFLLDDTRIVAWALIIGGIIMIALERLFPQLQKKDEVNAKDISIPQALGIGLFQSLAIIPGVSRSAATIIGGGLLGISRVQIVEFSFLVAVPVIVGASGLDLVKSSHVFSHHEWLLLTAGCVVAAIVAWISMKWLLKFVANHSFVPFGIYRIVLGILWLVIMV